MAKLVQLKIKVDSEWRDSLSDVAQKMGYKSVSQFIMDAVEAKAKEGGHALSESHKRGWGVHRPTKRKNWKSLEYPDTYQIVASLKENQWVFIHLHEWDGDLKKHLIQTIRHETHQIEVYMVNTIANPLTTKTKTYLVDMSVEATPDAMLAPLLEWLKENPC